MGRPWGQAWNAILTENEKMALWGWNKESRREKGR